MRRVSLSVDSGEECSLCEFVITRGMDVVDQWVFRIPVYCQYILLAIEFEQIGRDVLPWSCRGSVWHKRFLSVYHLVLLTCLA